MKTMNLLKTSLTVAALMSGTANLAHASIAPTPVPDNSGTLGLVLGGLIAVVSARFLVQRPASKR
jgi:hypothetical protein